MAAAEPVETSHREERASSRISVRARPSRSASSPFGFVSTTELRCACGLASESSGSVGRTPFGRGSDFDDDVLGAAPDVASAAAPSLAELDGANPSTAAFAASGIVPFPEATVVAASEVQPPDESFRPSGSRRGVVVSRRRRVLICIHTFLGEVPFDVKSVLFMSSSTD